MQRNILILTFNYSGGSRIFLQQYVRRTMKNCNVWVLKSDILVENPVNRKLKLLLSKYSSQEKIEEVFNSEIPILNEMLKKLNITEIFVNHMIHFDFAFTMNWLMNCRVPFTIFLHDYYSVCPNKHLQFCHSKFCELSRVHGICQYHLKGVDIVKWRKYWWQFLSSAEKIICPSSYAAGIVKSVYRNLNIEVQPHILDAKLSKTFKPKFAMREKLRITFMGNIFEWKGQEYLLKLNALIRAEKLPVEFVVIGTFDQQTPNRGLENLIKFLRVVSTEDFRKDILLKAANTDSFKNGME